MDKATLAALSKYRLDLILNLCQVMTCLTRVSTVERIEKADDGQGWKTLSQGISTHMVAAFDPSIIGEYTYLKLDDKLRYIDERRP